MPFNNTDTRNTLKLEDIIYIYLNYHTNMHAIHSIYCKQSSINVLFLWPIAFNCDLAWCHLINNRVCIWFKNAILFPLVRVSVFSGPVIIHAITIGHIRVKWIMHFLFGVALFFVLICFLLYPQRSDPREIDYVISLHWTFQGFMVDARVEGQLLYYGLEPSAYSM